MENQNQLSIVKVTAKEEQVEKGATFVEYILLVSLIAIAAITVLTVFGQRVSTRFSELGSAI